MVYSTYTPDRVEWRRVVIGDPCKGIGKAFMADVLAYFMAAGTSAVWLDVCENNSRARHVYAGPDFTETHREASLDNPTSTLIFMEYPQAEASTHEAKQG